MTTSDIKQNIIVNTATIPTTTATFHVPLIALQHNGNKLDLTRSNSLSVGSINQTKGVGGGGGGGGGISDCIDEHSTHQQQCNKKLNNMTKILTSSLTNNNGNGLLKQSSNMNIEMNNAITTGSCNINNKRHLNVTTSLDSKRIKNSSSVEIQTSPQLLQQLMAPTPQKQKSRLLLEKSSNSKWNPDGGGGNNNNNENGSQQQNGNNNNNSSMSSSSSSSSNSVLKNLLISGCDVSAGYICIVPMRHKKAAKA